MNFFSRSGQDQFLFEHFFRGLRNGVFVEAGLGEAGQFSNTLFFERFMGWRGCRIETGRLSELGALLEAHALGTVDYCAIDAEGRPLELLADFDPSRFNIRVLSVRGAEDGKLTNLLAARGYEQVARIDTDLIFKRRDVQRLPRTSVICAVWHGDRERGSLIEGHAANLARQTAPVECIYVFDGGDTPPQSVPGRKVVAHENLSIYQAWNVALSLVVTPFVMNLNLDDRLAPNAVELLEGVLLRENAALAGGDWKICYSQQDTDEVEPCYPADRLPFVNTWPPAAGTRTRLGSGTGERGTLGPATLWRMDTHIGAPRYPWRFPDGSLVKVAGDSCWWTIVTQHLKKKVVRVSDVIGNYYSHPNTQAEFRGPSDELELMGSLGVNLL